MHRNTTAKGRLISFFLCLIMIISILPQGQAAAVLKSAPMRSGNTQNGMVRVNLSSLGNPSRLNLTVYGSYTVNGKSSSSIASGTALQVNFNSSTGALSLTMNGQTTDMGSAFKLRRHATSGQNGIKIAQGRVPNNLYPGDFYFVVRSSGNSYKLYTIAYIYIEDYLYGVLPYEMGNSSGLEALKAQAVSARTYTVRAMSAASSSLYDVVDTTSDQVYSGTPSGNANCVAAVDATKGIVAMNNGAFTATYYTASNGGQTESVKNAWGSNTYSYLKVKDDPYDLANPASRKNSFFVKSSGKQSDTVLQNLLDNKAASAFGAGAQVIGVTGITPHTPKYASPSRLYTKMDFHVTYTLNGQASTGTLTFDIFGELEYTMAMSINSGKNELWSVSQVSDGFYVYARRYGHGIGMSQRGAMYMAQLGYTYDQILAFYFEGCSRVQYTFTRSILSPVVEGQESQEQITPENPADIEQAKDGTALVRLPSVNDTLALRTAAHSTAPVITELPYGATVQVYGQSGDYCLIGYGVLCGYVPMSSLTITGAIPASTSKSPTIPQSYGTVINTNSLNLRATAASNGTVLTTVPRNALLPILSIQGSWAHTQYGLRSGYVSTDYLSITGNNPSDTPAGNKAYITSQTWLRVTASTNGYVVASLPANTEVALLSTDGTWAMIRYNRQTGYVLSSAVNHVGGDTAQMADDQLAAGETYAIVSTSSTLNLRSIASTEGVLMDEMPTGTRLIVESYGKEWCTVRFRGIRGYVMTKYITLQSSPVSPTASPTGGQQARVTTEQGSLNLRASASSTSKVLTTVPQYAVISVTPYNSTWCMTSYNGHTGFVMTKFLTFITTATATPIPQITPAPTQAPAIQDSIYARVTTDEGSLNLRATSVSNSMVLRTIPRNEIIPILEQGAVWCKTTYGGYTGFVMTKFLTFLSAAPTLAPTYAPTQAPIIIPTQTPAGTLSARVMTVQGSLNMRARAESGATVLRTIPQYAVIPILEQGAVWCKTTYGGQTGYVMTSFLSFFYQQQATPAPAATATPIPSPTPLPDHSAPSYARVTTVSGSLNLRQQAKSGATILRTIPQYATVEVLRREGTWTLVTYGGYTGYVMTSFLTFLTSSATPVPTLTPTQAPTQAPTPTHAPGASLPQAAYARVTTVEGSLNMRYQASDSAYVMRTIPQNEIVIVRQWGAAWCHVTYSGSTGYVKTAFLTPLSSSPAATPTRTPAPTAAPSIGGNGATAQVVTEEGSLNLRKYPRGGNNIIGSIPQYAYVSVLSKGTEWTQITYNGTTGYVMTKFLSFGASGAPSGGSSANGSSGGTTSNQGTSATPTDYNAMVDSTLRVLDTAVLGQAKPASGNAVNMYKGCSTFATLIKTIPKTDYVIISAVGDEWCIVLYESTTGYCQRKDLEFEIYD